MENSPLENPAPTATVQFVNATISNPQAPKDPAVRAVIRKQAMKIAADTRRRGGSYGKHNLRQYPVFVQGRNDGSEAEEVFYLEELDAQIYHAKGSQSRRYQESPSKRTAAEENTTSSVTIPPKPSATGFELITIKNGFDIIDLSTLATYHLGRATAEALSSDPLQLLKLLEFKQWSYMSYVPSLYGSSACLDHAVDCIVARVRQIIAPNGETGEREVIRLYLRAINSLQKALNSPTQRLTADVLCATEILALYELLDPSGKERWMRHANGATNLIQLRGPETYNTEFEKALFLAHSGPIMTESLLNNEKCFLAQPAWQAVFQSLIVPGQEEISDRSQAVVSLLILKSQVSALFADITGPVCRPEADNSSQLNSLVSQASVLHTALLNWRSSYDHLLTYTPIPCVGSMEYNKRCEIMSTYISCRMISNRLLTAISFRSSESSGLEAETQLMAHQMLELEMQVTDVCPHTKLFLAQTMFVAKATIATADDWVNVSSGGEDGIIIEKWRFERWCELFGRKVS